MIKLLVQVMASLISVVVAFLAAYIIYLYSVQSNVDQKIENEGAKVVRLFKDYPQNSNPFWMGEDLIKSYLKEFPDKRRLDIVNEIGMDLMIAGSALPDDEKKNHIKKMSEYSNDELPHLGRIFFFIMDIYMKGIIRNPEPTIVMSFHEDIERTEQIKRRKEFFPYGPLGVEAWVEDFKRVSSGLDILYMWKEGYIKDLNEYLNGIKDKKERDFYNRFNCEEWLTESHEVYKTTSVHVNRISSLIRLKKHHEIDVRLPNLKWIVVFLIIAFVVGIAIPLVLLGLGLDSNIPVVFNIVILISSFSFFVGGAFLLGKDIVSQEYHLKNTYLLERIPRSIAAGW